MIPISDINPAVNTPYITRLFIFLTIGIYLLIQPKDSFELFNFFYEYSAIPCEIKNGYPLSANQFYSNSCMATVDNVGKEYVWGRYDLLCLPPSFPYGGMENPCLTFVTPTLLAGDKSLADVVAHEIAHR